MCVCVCVHIFIYYINVYTRVHTHVHAHAHAHAGRQADTHTNTHTHTLTHTTCELCEVLRFQRAFVGREACSVCVCVLCVCVCVCVCYLSEVRRSHCRPPLSLPLLGSEAFIMCVCVYIYIHTYMHTFTHTYVCMYVMCVTFGEGVEGDNRGFVSAECRLHTSLRRQINPPECCWRAVYCSTCHGVEIEQQASAVSIRHYTSAYVSIRVPTAADAMASRSSSAALRNTSATSAGGPAAPSLGYAYVTSAYVSYVSIRQHTSAYVSIRQHTSAYAICAGGPAAQSFM
jgi:hypothetical protein